MYNHSVGSSYMSPYKKRRLQRMKQKKVNAVMNTVLVATTAILFSFVMHMTMLQLTA